MGAVWGAKERVLLTCGLSRQPRRLKKRMGRSGPAHAEGWGKNAVGCGGMAVRRPAKKEQVGSHIGVKRARQRKFGLYASEAARLDNF